MFDDAFYDFYFPESGTPCKVCEENIPLEKYRNSGLCDDCEFDSLAPPMWPALFLGALAVWKQRRLS